MPFFFIAPIWLLCVIAGLLTLISRRFRFLASYLILGSTFGFIISILASTASLLIVGKLTSLLGSSAGAIVVILGFLVGMVGGGVAGILVGGWMAYRLNRRFGLKYAN